eukprot:1915921-Amphidinium_carterae.1
MNPLGAGEEAQRRPLGPAVPGAPGGAQGTNNKNGAALPGAPPKVDEQAEEQEVGVQARRRPGEAENQRGKKQRNRAERQDGRSAWEL